MKLQNHLSTVVGKFNEVYTNNRTMVDEHIKNVKAEGAYNKLEVRIAYDLARALRYWEWDFVQDRNDNVITTLLVKALKKSEIQL